MKITRTVLLLLITALLAACATGNMQGDAGSASTIDNSDLFAPKSTADVSVIPQAPVVTKARRRARIRLELAGAHYQRRNYSTALEEIRQALAADSAFPAAYSMLGLVYMALEDNPRAETSFRRALTLSPGNAEYSNNYGWFLCQNGREQEALPFFENAANDRRYPTPSKALHNAGVCLLKSGDEAGAEKYLQRSFKVNPQDAVAMFNLGEIYLSRKELDRAHFYSQRLVKAYEPAAKTLWLALRVEHARGDRIGLLSLSSKLRKGFPDSFEAKLLKEGKFDE